MDNQQQIMNVQEQIEKYITSQPEPKRSDMQALHRIITGSHARLSIMVPGW